MNKELINNIIKSLNTKCKIIDNKIENKEKELNEKIFVSGTDTKYAYEKNERKSIKNDIKNLYQTNEILFDIIEQLNKFP